MQFTVDRNPVATREILLNVKNMIPIIPEDKYKLKCIRDHCGIEKYKLLNYGVFDIIIPGIRVYGKKKNRFTLFGNIKYDYFSWESGIFFAFVEYIQNEDKWIISEDYPYILKIQKVNRELKELEENILLDVLSFRLELYKIGNRKPFEIIEINNFDDEEKFNGLYSWIKPIIKQIYKIYYEYMVLDEYDIAYERVMLPIKLYVHKYFRCYNFMVTNRYLPICVDIQSDITDLNINQLEVLKDYGILIEKFTDNVYVMRLIDDNYLHFIPSRKLIKKIYKTFFKDENIYSDLHEYYFCYHNDIIHFDIETIKREIINKILQQFDLDDLPLEKLEEYGDIEITFQDSIDAGNCRVMTEEFCKKYNLDIDGSKPIKWFLNNWNEFTEYEKRHLYKIFIYKIKKLKQNEIENTINENE